MPADRFLYRLGGDVALVGHVSRRLIGRKSQEHTRSISGVHIFRGISEGLCRLSLTYSPGKFGLMCGEPHSLACRAQACASQLHPQTQWDYNVMRLLSGSTQLTCDACIVASSSPRSYQLLPVHPSIPSMRSAFTPFSDVRPSRSRTRQRIHPDSRPATGYLHAA